MTQEQIEMLKRSLSGVDLLLCNQEEKAIVRFLISQGLCEKKAMKKVLSDIQDGTFAKEFLLDMSDAGAQVHFKAMRKLASEHQSEKVGEEIRKLYSWNGDDKLINN